MYNRIKKLLALLVVVTVIAAGFVTSNADGTAESGVNKFNVVLVLDASESMKKTDPDGYRYEALEQFIFMLADTDNYLGCVVFDTKIKAESELSLVTGQEEKNAVIETLESVSPNHGYTNIGDALQAAVDMIETSGNPDLPSVIVFLSDGNTDMPTDSEIEESLETKADAIEEARDAGIAIYSVCLNANGSADITEMQQISEATGGVFNEVTTAADLQDVLSSFYALIYNTVPVPIEAEVFPDSGIITKTFNIPGLGVEEANFLIYGEVDSITIYDPTGAEYPAETLINSTCGMAKVMNPVPGDCTVEIHGEPGTTIYGNMVYNVNLVVVGSSDLNQMTGSTSTPVNFNVQLGTGSVMATDPSQYNGFSAELIISDAYGTDLETISMTLGDNGFDVAKTFDAGTYNFRFHVSGYDLEKESEVYGPFTIVVAAPNVTPTPVPNSAPEPVEEEKEYTKYVIPFMDNTLEIPVTDLATDAEDPELVYQIESSSFLEGDDYTFDGKTITMTNYSLSKGDYIVKAIDTGGLSCEVKVKVKAINVGLITVITLGVIALLVLIGIIWSLWYWKGRRLKGTLTFIDASNNPKTLNNAHGQIRIKRLGNNYAGFDPRKTYIQCTGKDHVFFVSNKKFVGGRGAPTKKLKINGNNSDVRVNLPNNPAQLTIRFQKDERKAKAHRAASRGRSGGAARGGARSVRSARPAGGRPTGARPSGGRGPRR